MKSFWHGKRVFLTGHTGFKGSWLTLLLHRLGASIHGLSLPPITSPSLFEIANITSCCKSTFGDIRDLKIVQESICEHSPDIVIHLAAQALVRHSYKDPLQTHTTNIIGTANLLESLRKSPSTRVAVIITTDKVYSNQDLSWAFRENEALGGFDPYSSSKAAAEIITNSYYNSFLKELGISVATARAGNVVGGGDWSCDRLIPDAIRAWSNDEALEIRSPNATRPWQHVIEPLWGYLQLAQWCWNHPSSFESFNFGPRSDESSSVAEVTRLASHVFGKGEIKAAEANYQPHEAKHLALDIAKARRTLGFSPKWGLEQSIERTINWYKNFLNGEDPLELCHCDLGSYFENGK